MSGETFEMFALPLQRLVSLKRGKHVMPPSQGERDVGRNRLRPVQAHEPMYERPCGANHSKVGTQAINTHEIASHVAPGDQKRA